ncbi:Aste57867_11933 [Aphanomyces stellatus]|uniref:Aste57867_11933 protein n=1 Tax=Aphanomyces stellatus TaxID=120398 RepID=A0A485KU96_9STRA|nr:hypothetical protein As57867_011888 [Aphanomyces stellatus]VFT88788.1 Aste57867_11933 [Aphanomyces stellatus]
MVDGFLVSVKNLPTALSANAIETLLKHVGATEIRVLANRNKKKSAIAAFPSDAVRTTALVRLNKMRLADHQLCAAVLQRMKVDATDEAPSSAEVVQVESPSVQVPPPPVFPPLPCDPPLPSHLWRQAAPLAPHLGWNDAASIACAHEFSWNSLHYPSSPLLEYKYPKATPDIVLNIANALMALPKLYTQVLHLMNKMNLPPPFEPNAIPGHFTKKRKRPTEETFVASDDEDTATTAEHLELAAEPPAVQASIIAIPTTSKKPAKAPPTGLRKPAAKGIVPAALVNIFHADDTSHVTQLVPRPGVISEAELNRTRLPPQELSQNKYMQGYVQGTPSTVLYVKNIAKSVDVSDMTYLFGCVFVDNDSMSRMAVKLFQEGRLKGQAFVEYPSVDLATLALQVTHGVVLDEKPLIVCFRKPQAPPPTDANESTAAVAT